ncbi:MAG: hypothetical protein ACI9H8_000745 [Lysobacterales bacterium]|jgi:hypothetical protein
MHKLLLWLGGLAFLAVTPVTFAAKMLGPPIEGLYDRPDLTRIVVAVANEKVAPSRLRFVVSEQLSGQSPEEVLLRTDESAFANIVAGNSYLVAWTDMRRNRALVEGWEKDPDGPSTVNVPGLGTTAIFEDTPEIRFLFEIAKKDKADTSARQINALFTQMERPDSHSRALMIMQLYLRPDLRDKMDQSQIGQLKNVILQETLETQQLDFLLRTAIALPRDQTTPWLEEEFRRIIIFHGSQYDLASFIPGLVRTAARGLQQTGGLADIELLGNLLYSNNPGVAVSALKAMSQIDDKATVVKAQQAIDRNWIHDETRREVELYLYTQVSDETNGPH